ncbi:AAA family ATPase [Neolewinella lacunae]|uniref:AAA family ATPase n=1 Tax=Neolewinella lacunae TaxID=1517758 RepID=A0A923TBI6_9BACT|nr:AAA family ATPase [Neolewinella lacunae]MBC6992637.1 AAA family ATPase [Neolewinella lacunae]MDN3633516.1 AAA family ATPase [Neolewinella lacunae]
MDRLKLLSAAAARRVSLDFVRPLYHNIDWEGNLTALLGARGVGKTTLLLQRLKVLDLPPETALYVDLGDLYFQENRLLDFIVSFVEQGGRYLFLDEVHRYGYQTWAQELKQAYDLYHGELRIAFTGSAAIRILDQKADLSRRALQFRVPGLSFREYLILVHGIELPTYTYSDILQHHQAIVQQHLGLTGFHPLPLLQRYWQEGYYPFMLADPAGYLRRVNVMIQLVLDSDLPAVIKTGRVDYQKISRLLYAIASSVPFTPNIAKLGERLGMARETILQYLHLLEQSDLISTLRSEAKGISFLTKPDKIYLNNPNLMHALAPGQVEVGTLRETFFLNQLLHTTYESHILPPEIRLPKVGDFALLDKETHFLFEVGGPNKSSKQIGPGANHFVVRDVESSVGQRIIPLWLFGLLY